MTEERVLLCEGFHDRSFLKGWILRRAKCSDPGAPKGGGPRERVVDHARKPVSEGQYLFHTPTENHVRVVPCHGDSKLVPAAVHRVRRATQNVRRVVLCVDDDGTSPPGVADRAQRVRMNLLNAIQKDDSSAALNVRGEIVAGQILLSVVSWHCHDEPAPGIPSQQSLERLVCASIAAAGIADETKVAAWLSSISMTSHKSHA